MNRLIAMIPKRLILLTAGSLLALWSRGPAEGAEAAATEPLPLKLPAPTLKGTPEDLQAGPNVDPLSKTPRPPFLAPKSLFS